MSNLFKEYIVGKMFLLHKITKYLIKKFSISSVSCMFSEFPNAFILFGPSTGLGHTSIIFNIECQINYALDCIRKTKQKGKKVIELKQEVLDNYVNWQRKVVKGRVFASGCDSWYKNKAGEFYTIWPGSTIQYWWQIYSCKEEDYYFY